MWGVPYSGDQIPDLRHILLHIPQLARSYGHIKKYVPQAGSSASSAVVWVAPQWVERVHEPVHTPPSALIIQALCGRCPSNLSLPSSLPPSLCLSQFLSHTHMHRVRKAEADHIPQKFLRIPPITPTVVCISGIRKDPGCQLPPSPQRREVSLPERAPASANTLPLHLGVLISPSAQTGPDAEQVENRVAQTGAGTGDQSNG